MRRGSNSLRWRSVTPDGWSGDAAAGAAPALAPAPASTTAPADESVATRVEFEEALASGATAPPPSTGDTAASSVPVSMPETMVRAARARNTPLRVGVFCGRGRSDECTVGNPTHGGACWWCTVGHPAREFRDTRLLTVTTGTGWTRPRAGFAQMFQHLSKWAIHRAHQALLFFSAERGTPQLRARKWYLYPRFDSVAGL